jgi:hypothetical protein
MSPYDDPAVSAGEIADYLDALRLEATPSPAPSFSTIRAVQVANEYAYRDYPAASDNNEQYN